MKKFHPIADIFPLMQGEDYENFKADIRANGLHESIWLHPEDDSIIDGRNRYRACLDLGIEPIYQNWTGRGSLIAFVVSLNLHRRHLTTGQWTTAATKALPFFEAEAKERQVKGGETTHGHHYQENNKQPKQQNVLQLGEIFPQAVTTKPDKKERAAKSTEQVAEKFNTNGRYVADCKRLQSTHPHLFSLIESGRLEIPDARRLEKFSREDQDIILKMVSEGISKNIKAAIRKLSKERQIEQIEQLEPPKGKYHVIVIDPPWEYKNRAKDVTHRAANPYPSMTVQEIINQTSIPDLALDNCILWLWTTNAFMKQAHEVAEAWGFTVKTILTWVKDKMGLGDWLRGQTEHCLMCVKGAPVIDLTNQTTVIYGPLREHSRKPDAFYEMVEALCPGTKIELFSRQLREGWETHGNEPNKFQG
jgi:N6-adenosine-specific RNA methylase IME4